MQNEQLKATPHHPSNRFVRRTRLVAGEYRKNFRQIDGEIISALTSREADLVTPLMSKIYLQLINAPPAYWERDGVLRFEARNNREGDSLNAWKSLCALLGVASATARKALSWMHEVGVIGYFSGKNGVGIRIFINRAASSIGDRQSAQHENIPHFRTTSPGESHASHAEAAFKDSFAVLETLDSDINSDALKFGANEKNTRMDLSASVTRPAAPHSMHSGSKEINIRSSQQANETTISVNEFIRRLKSELEESLQQTARQAASREHQRTREWLEKAGLPKAARVAQREAYNVLHKSGMINQTRNWSGLAAEVGRSDYVTETQHTLSCEEIEELAGACIAMLEAKGQSIDLTLSDMSASAGGFLREEDLELVREKTKSYPGSM